MTGFIEVTEVYTTFKLIEKDFDLVQDCWRRLISISAITSVQGNRIYVNFSQEPIVCKENFEEIKKKIEETQVSFAVIKED